MRWSIIRTIWFRDMRDQMRDRRTLLVILGLPLVLYPLLGVGLSRFATAFTERQHVIGVVTGSPAIKEFPPRQPPSAGLSVIPRLSLLAATPIDHWASVVTLTHASHRTLDYGPLVEWGRFRVFDSKDARGAAARLKIEFLEQVDPALLAERRVDLILEAPRDFYAKLESGDVDLDSAAPLIRIHDRTGDDDSKLALRNLAPVLGAWKLDLRKVRLARKGLTERFLEPFEVRLPPESLTNARESVGNLVVRIFPFVLVMWTLAGALYPAVDLCAGEKERGTMETLLISPAGREEIVLGKFLTIWVFSSATALLNLLSMGITSALLASQMPHGSVSPAALAWCVVLSLPQSAFFSALALAIGAYARSSKEGQYYLMPLFLVTMPLIFLTLAPGVRLNPLYSLVPVTGVALLMQSLMTARNLGEIPWAYFVPVLAPIALYSWLALRWAIEQFNREDVLFREAERLDVGLWFKSLFRDKEPLPTTGQAFFCLAMLIGLRWLSLGLGRGWSLEIHTMITQLAFVATPPLFMAMLLNTLPTDGLYLRWPTFRETIFAALLALLLLAPMAGLTQAVASWFPQLLDGDHPLIAILRAIVASPDTEMPPIFRYFIAFALVPAVCEEVAFRGFLLQGLHHGFRPRNAVLLSSFFFALFHMNVFLFVPTFVFGVVLGLLTVRSRSLLPAIAFHLLHNTILIALIPISRYSDGQLPQSLAVIWPWWIGVSLALAAALVWWLYRKPYSDLERIESEAGRQASSERV